MPLIEAVVEGVVLSISERQYDSFTDRSGQERAAGVSRRLWIGESEHSVPVSIRVPQASGEGGKLLTDGFGRGDEVRAVCGVTIEQAERPSFGYYLRSLSNAASK